MVSEELLKHLFDTFLKLIAGKQQCFLKINYNREKFYKNGFAIAIVLRNFFTEMVNLFYIVILKLN